jgi:hypothetical protein
MAEQTKVVKGGLRATLALILSAIALVFALAAFNRSGSRADLSAEIRSLQQRIKDMKQETTARLETVRQETGDAIERIGKAVKKDDSRQ